MPAPRSMLSIDPPAPDRPPDCEADDLPGLRLIRVPDWGQPFDGDPVTADGAAWSAGQFGTGWDRFGPGSGQQPRDAATGGDATGTGSQAADGNTAAGNTAPEDSQAADGSQAQGQADSDGVPRESWTEQAEASSQWAQQFARLLAEALAGARPVRQILPWTSKRARGHLGRVAPLFGGGQRPRVLRVITTRPTREVIEMTVIVGVGTRTRALAVRLEQAAPHRLARPAEYATRAGASLAGAHRWVCTDIETA